jgi:hypothetical protein
MTLIRMPTRATLTARVIASQASAGAVLDNHSELTLRRR